jgi:hypothetical protein
MLAAKNGAWFVENSYSKRFPPGKGEMENIGNIEIEKYRIGF